MEMQSMTVRRGVITASVKSDNNQVHFVIPKRFLLLGATQCCLKSEPS